MNLRNWPFLMQWKQKHKGGLSELTRSSGALVHCNRSKPCILHTMSIAASSLCGNFAQIRRGLEGLRLTSNQLFTSTHNSLARIRHMTSPNHRAVKKCCLVHHVPRSRAHREYLAVRPVKTKCFIVGCTLQLIRNILPYQWQVKQ